MADKTIPELAFTKDWKSASDFPTVATDEAQIRADMQCLHDETRDYINEKLIPALEEQYVPTTRTVNGKALSADIDLTAEDVGALSEDAAGDLSVAHAGTADTATRAGSSDAVQAPVIEGSILEWAVNLGVDSSNCQHFVTNTASTDLPDGNMWHYASGTLHNRFGYKVIELHIGGADQYVAHNKYGNGAWSGWVVTKLDQQSFARLAPVTQISEGADLNSVEYLKVGAYYCSSNAVAATIANSPTGSAFMMLVYAPTSPTINNEETGTYVYRVRKILVYNGAEYVQQVGSGATAGAFTYGAWVKILKADNYMEYAVSKFGNNTIEHPDFGGQLRIKRTAAAGSGIAFENSDGVLGYLGFFTDGTPIMYDATAENKYPLLYTGNTGLTDLSISTLSASGATTTVSYPAGTIGFHVYGQPSSGAALVEVFIPLSLCTGKAFQIADELNFATFTVTADTSARTLTITRGTDGAGLITNAFALRMG